MGSSWITTLFGWITIIGDVVNLIARTASEQGVPSDFASWVQFIMVLGSGIGLLFAKDFNKTNSQHPLTTAAPAPAVSVPK